MLNIINFKQIGIIYSSLKTIENMPIQPLNFNSAEGTIELFHEYTEGLKDVEYFSHLILIYYFHEVKESKLNVKPFMDNDFHGIFATRAPVRPNPIGFSTVRLIKIEENLLFVDNIDILDNTPLLDIKPFFEKFDNRYNTKAGWLDKNDEVFQTKSDSRFK